MKRAKCYLKKPNIFFCDYLLTSSADCAMKKPTVFEGSLVPRGFMEILLSLPSSLLTSIANSKSFNLTKHNLQNKNKPMN